MTNLDINFNMRMYVFATVFRKSTETTLVSKQREKRPSVKMVLETYQSWYIRLLNYFYNLNIQIAVCRHEWYELTDNLHTMVVYLPRNETTT